jgi:hypothetical protein
VTGGAGKLMNVLSSFYDDYEDDLTTIIINDHGFVMVVVAPVSRPIITVTIRNIDRIGLHQHQQEPIHTACCDTIPL